MKIDKIAGRVIKSPSRPPYKPQLL